MAAATGCQAVFLGLLLLLTRASAWTGPCSSTGKTHVLLATCGAQNGLLTLMPAMHAVTNLDFSLPASTGCGWRCRGVLYVHSPVHSQPPEGATSACPYPGPFPLVVFISGFLVRMLSPQHHPHTVDLQCR